MTETKITTRADAIKGESMKAFANADMFLEEFKTSISTYGIDELKDIKANINSGLVSTKRKILKANWDLGNAVSVAGHEQLSNFSKNVRETPYTVVETENAKGEIVLTHTNNFGLKQVKPNTDEVIIRMLQLQGIDAGLTNKYRKATAALEDSNLRYIESEDSGSDKELGEAMRNRMTAISTMNKLKREIAKITPSVVDGRDFAVSMHKGCIAALNERKNEKSARVKIMGSQTSLIQARLNQLDKIGYGNIAMEIGTQYNFNKAACYIADPSEK